MLNFKYKIEVEVYEVVIKCRICVFNNIKVCEFSVCYLGFIL